MPAHEQLKNALEERIAGRLVDRINFRYFGLEKVESDTFSSRYIVLDEVTVRAKDPQGEEIEAYRIDAVLFVNPRVDSIKRRATYTVGIEIKGEYGDLMSDSKMQYYLGHTDLFFLAVPAELVEAAKRKIIEIETIYLSAMNRIGLLNLDTGLVENWPERQPVSLDCRYRLHEAALWAMCKDRVHICQSDNILEESVAVEVEDSEDSTIAKMRDEKVAQRTANRERSRVARDEQYKEAAERARELVPSVRDKLAAMLPADAVVFWAIRDATEEGGIDAKVVATQTQQSDSCVTRAIRKLREAGMVTLEGSKKTGKFVTINEANESSRCLLCIHRDECDGNSLKCGSFERAPEEVAENSDDTPIYNIGVDEQKPADTPIIYRSDELDSGQVEEDNQSQSE